MGMKQIRFHIGCSLKVKNITAWLERRNVRNKATYSIRATGNVYIIDGHEIQETDFDSLHPVELFPPTSKRENYDRTKNFITNKKSY